VRVIDLFGWVCLLYGVGCASQADLVKLEDDFNQTTDTIEILKQDQQTLQERFISLSTETSEMNRQVSDRSGGDKKTLTDTTIRLDSLSAEIETLNERIEEDRHLLAVLEKRVDDNAFVLSALDGVKKNLSGRLDTLQTRLSALEKPEGSTPDSSTLSFESPAPEEPPDPMTAPFTSEESLPNPSEAYHLAYNDYLQGNYDLAIIGFQNFQEQYPDSALIPQAIFGIGESYYNKKLYLQAIGFYEQVHRNYPKSEKAPIALLKEGISYMEKNNPIKAKEYFTKLIHEFPRANEAKLAKDKLATLPP